MIVVVLGGRVSGFSGTGYLYPVVAFSVVVVVLVVVALVAVVLRVVVVLFVVVLLVGNVKGSSGTG
jgi:hypothetical protein